MGYRSGRWRLLLCVALLWTGATPVLAASRDALRLNEEGIVLTAGGRYDEAAARFEQALRLSPGDQVIRGNLARVRTVRGHQYLHAGSLSQAEGQYQAAVDLNPNESAALLGLGDIQLRQRQPRIATELYRRAVEADPANADAFARLGEGYYQQGDRAAALSAWEQALAHREDVNLRHRVEDVRREVRVQTGYASRESQHFAITYEGQRREDVGRELLQILERAYADVGYELGVYPPYEVQVIFYSDADFERAVGAPHSVVGGAYYQILDGRIRVALRGLMSGDPRLASDLYHEYTHALIYAITRGNNPPRWVHEGLAVHMERRRAPEFRQEAIRLARVEGTVPPLDQSPYTHGSAAIEYLIDRYGIGRIRQTLRRMGEGQSFAQAFQETFQRDVAAFQRELRDALARGY